MTYQEFKDAAFAQALALGARAAEGVYIENENFRVGILSGEIDSYSVSNAYGFGLRVELDGKNGYAYTENFSDPAQLAARAVDNARAIDSEDLSPMQGAQAYEAVKEPEQPVCDMNPEQRIALARRLEQAAAQADEKITRVQATSLSCGNSRLHISNTLGLDASRQSRSSLAYTVPIAMQPGSDEQRDGLAFRSGKDILDIDGCAKEAAENAAAMLGASPAPSGTYAIILKNTAACDFFEAFSDIFSAESAQKGLSPLSGREGEDIASPCVTICDDPFDARSPRAFDDEGTPSCATTLIKDGIFTGFLHNLKTARKAGAESTSNAYRASAASPVSIAPTNFILSPGTDSYETLLGKLESGLVITDVSGLHAGLNPISGDFSLLSSGFLVENGKIVRPVDRITIAGNFLNLLKDILCTGSDIRVSPTSNGIFALPSLLIRELMVAGE